MEFNVCRATIAELFVRILDISFTLMFATQIYALRRDCRNFAFAKCFGVVFDNAVV